MRKFFAPAQLAVQFSMQFPMLFFTRKVHSVRRVFRYLASIAALTMLGWGGGVAHAGVLEECVLTRRDIAQWNTMITYPPVVIEKQVPSQDLYIPALYPLPALLMGQCQGQTFMNDFPAVKAAAHLPGEQNSLGQYIKGGSHNASYDVDVIMAQFDTEEHAHTLYDAIHNYVRQCQNSVIWLDVTNSNIPGERLLYRMVNELHDNSFTSFTAIRRHQLWADTTHLGRKAFSVVDYVTSDSQISPAEKRMINSYYYDARIVGRTVILGYTHGGLGTVNNAFESDPRLETAHNYFPDLLATRLEHHH